MEVVVCKELTKKFERVWRGRIREVLKELEREEIKGEFVIVVKK